MHPRSSCRALCLWMFFVFAPVGPPIETIVPWGISPNVPFWGALWMFQAKPKLAKNCSADDRSALSQRVQFLGGAPHMTGIKTRND